MIGSVSRRAALATLLGLAGCGSPPPLDSTHPALVAGCNSNADCIAAYGTNLGSSATVTCDMTSHVCQVATTASCVADSDCDDDNPCTTDGCPTGSCLHVAVVGGSCCVGAVTCAAGNSCQTAVCSNFECGFVAKSAAACCNVGADCSGAATCVANQCSCSATTPTYCDGIGCVTGTECCTSAQCSGGNVCVDGSCTCPAGDKSCGATCVPTGGCCLAADCPAGNSCQAPTCSAAGACGLASNGNPGCCNDDSSCGGGSTCDTTTNRCVCGAGQKLCAGATPGADVCTAGCCVAGDCAAIPNGTVACDPTTHTCVPAACNATFHACSGACVSNGSVNSCGATSCSACAAGDACQTAVCNAATSCGFVASGPSPCCNTVTDCVAANSCQVASACNSSTNRCKFDGKTGVAGCCALATDCAAPGDPCLERTCIANQCGTTPIAGCSDDGGVAPDLSLPAADLSVPADLGAPADLAQPRDLAAPGQALSFTGGGGCAVAGRPASPLGGALLFAVGLLLALGARRRRSHRFQ